MPERKYWGRGSAEDPGRCAIVLPDFNGGGAERMALEILKRWPEEWQPPTVVVRASGGELEGEFRSLSFEVRVAGSERSGWGSWWRLVILLRRLTGGPEGIRCVVSFLTMLPAQAAVFQKSGVAHVASCQNPPFLRRWVRRRASSWAGRRAARLVPIAPGIGQEFERLGVRPERIAVIPNAVDNARFREVVRTEDSSQTRVTVLGRLHPQKRIDRALRVFERYACEYAEGRTELVICGSGPLEGQVNRWVSDTECCDGKVTLAGFTRNVPELLANSDCVLVTSDFEGFGNVIVEALAAGVPVVAARVPYGPEYILGQDGRLGRLCEPNHIECLAEGVADSVRGRWDAELVAARRDRAEEFDSEKVVNSWLSVLADSRG